MLTMSIIACGKVDELNAVVLPEMRWKLSGLFKLSEAAALNHSHYGRSYEMAELSQLVSVIARLTVALI